MTEYLPSLLDVSVVLPVFDERGHLDEELNRIRSSLDSSGYSYEIIVVDDGSTDGSGERLREIEGIRLIQFHTNRGSGSARKYGTLQARGRVVVWTDVDMTYPNDEIPRFVKELDGGWDQVVGAQHRAMDKRYGQCAQKKGDHQDIKGPVNFGYPRAYGSGSFP